MTRYDYPFEGGTVGAAAAAPDAGEAFGVAGGASIIYDNTHVLQGSKSLKHVPVAGSVCYNRIKSGLNTPRIGVIAPLWFDTAPTNDTFSVGVFDTAGNRVAQILRNGNNQTRVYDKSGSTAALSPYPGTTAAPLAGWCTTKVWLELGADATSGKIKMAVYKPDGSLNEPIFTSAAMNLGTTNIGSVRIGKGDTGAYASAFWADIVSIDDAATDLLTDYSSGTIQPPVVTIPANQTVQPGAQFSLTATATGGNGNTLSYSWAYTFPTTGGPALSGANTATASATAGAAGSLYIARCTVSDGTNTTVSAPVEVYVPLAASGTEMLPIAATPSGTWAGTGGTTGAVIADSSDATYLASPTVTGSEAVTRFRLAPSNTRTDLTTTLRVDKSDSGSCTIKARIFVGPDASTPVDEWTIAPSTSITDVARVHAASVIAAISAVTDGWKILRLEVAATQ